MKDMSKQLLCQKARQPELIWVIWVYGVLSIKYWVLSIEYWVLIGEQADLRRSWQVRVGLHRDRLVGVVRAEVLVHLNKLGNCQNLAIILFIIKLIRLKPILYSRVMTFCFSEKTNYLPNINITHRILLSKRTCLTSIMLDCISKSTWSTSPSF